MSEPSFEAAEPSADQIGATSFSAAPVTRKQEFNVYTLMLIIAFVALLVGTLLLFMELNRYGSFPGSSPWKTIEAEPSGISWIQYVTDRFNV